MDEAKYPHQVCVATFEGDELREVQTPEIPRAVQIMRLPKDGPKEKDEVLPELEKLPPADEEHPPYLEVRVRLERPESALRREMTEVLDGKNARLVKLTVEYTGTGQALGDALPKKQLQDLKPEQMFSELYKQHHEGEPSDELMSCFREIVEATEHEEDA